MIVSHRVALVSATEFLIDAIRDRLKAVFAEADRAYATDPDRASLLCAEGRAQAEFVGKLVDLLEEQKAAVRRASEAPTRRERLLDEVTKLWVLKNDDPAAAAQVREEYNDLSERELEHEIKRLSRR